MSKTMAAGLRGSFIYANVRVFVSVPEPMRQWPTLRVVLDLCR